MSAKGLVITPHILCRQNVLHHLKLWHCNKFRFLWQIKYQGTLLYRFNMPSCLISGHFIYTYIYVIGNIQLFRGWIRLVSTKLTAMLWSSAKKTDQKQSDPIGADEMCAGAVRSSVRFFFTTDIYRCILQFRLLFLRAESGTHGLTASFLRLQGIIGTIQSSLGVVSAVICDLIVSPWALNATCKTVHNKISLYFFYYSSWSHRVAINLWAISRSTTCQILTADAVLDQFRHHTWRNIGNDLDLIPKLSSGCPTATFCLSSQLSASRQSCFNVHADRTAVAPAGTALFKFMFPNGRISSARMS